MRRGARWKLVGNAVSTPVAAWFGSRLAQPGKWSEPISADVDGSWPTAAWGRGGKAFTVELSEWPVADHARPHLLDFIQHDGAPLSSRATAGFLARTSQSSLRFPEGFLEDVADHLERVQRVERQLSLLG